MENKKKLAVQEQTDDERKLMIAGYSDLARLANEVTVDLSKCALTWSNGGAEIEACYDFMKIGATAIDGVEPIDVVGSNALSRFTFLFTKAANLWTDETHYVTALKFNYGIANNKIKVLYQPILLVRNKDLGSDGKVYTYTEKTEMPIKYYSWKGQEDGFEEISAGNILTAYSQNMKIKHFTNASAFTNYVDGIDTKCLTLTFQEIFRLIDDSDKANYIWIYNAVVSEENDHDHEIEIRHSLLLAAMEFIPQSVDFRGKFANLAHLCPPNCKVILRQNP